MNNYFNRLDTDNREEAECDIGELQTVNCHPQRVRINSPPVGLSTPPPGSFGNRSVLQPLACISIWHGDCFYASPMCRGPCGLTPWEQIMSYPDHEHAQTLLEIAKEEIADGDTKRGYKLLNLLIVVFPDTPAADEASEFLMVS